MNADSKDLKQEKGDFGLMPFQVFICVHLRKAASK